MREQSKQRDVVDRLCSILENLDESSAEDLQMLLSNLNLDMKAEEESFIGQLRLMRHNLEVTSEAENQECQVAGVTAADVAPLRGLIAEAKKRGLSTAEFAEAIQLSASLITKLDLRLIRYSSIPQQVIEDIANAIKRSSARVALYLQGEPIRVADAYSAASDALPESQKQQGFFEEVSADASLSEIRRARLMKMREVTEENSNKR